MKTQPRDRNTTRPLGSSGCVRETLGSVLPGSAIVPVSGGRFRPRLHAAAFRCGAFRLC